MPFEDSSYDKRFYGTHYSDAEIAVMREMISWFTVPNSRQEVMPVSYYKLVHAFLHFADANRAKFVEHMTANEDVLLTVSVEQIVQTSAAQAAQDSVSFYAMRNIVGQEKKKRGKKSTNPSRRLHTSLGRR